MPGNYSETPCSSCGRTVRSTDKFCIFCGNRLAAAPPPKTAASPPSQALPKAEEEQIEKEVNSDLAAVLQNVKKKKEEEVPKKTLPFAKKGKKDGEEEVEDDSKIELELPDSIKVQLDAKLELAVIDEKKKRLKTRLTEIAANAEEDRYNWDMEFAEEVNRKLEALKTIKEELSKEEEKWRAALGERFILDEYDDVINEKRAQLVELRRSYKLRSIKKEVYEELKLEYTGQFREAEDKAQQLRKEIIRWLSRESSEKNKIETRLKILKGRLKTKEIDNEAFESQKKELEKERDRLIQRINILDHYANDKTKKFL
jgi:hypothetical protein